MHFSSPQPVSRLRRLLRSTRIAFSVACGVLCVLLIMLWVRSYWRMDVVHIPASRETLLNSARGVFHVGIAPKGKSIGWNPVWEWQPFPSSTDPDRPTWQWRMGNFAAINFPIWSAVLACGLAAAAPWFPQRFSLRTLLIAATVVAVGLGVIIMLARAR